MAMSFFGLKNRFACIAGFIMNDKKGIKLIDFARKYALDRLKTGQKTYQGRCGSVLTMVKHLENFQKKYKKEKYGAVQMLLKDVDVEFCKQFIDYLYHANDLHHDMKKNKKLSESTINQKVLNLKSVLQEAVKLGYLKENPFHLLPSSYHIKPVQKEKATLSDEEMKKLVAAPCQKPLMKEAYCLSCFTGLRESDIFTLSSDDIMEEDGVYYIHKRMQKTQRMIHIPLSKESVEILRNIRKNQMIDSDTKKGNDTKEGNEGEPFCYFSCLSQHHLNEHLKKWLADNQITSKPITFHCARHTYASRLLKQGVDIYTISQLLGHSSIQTTQKYLHIGNKCLAEANNKISQNLSLQAAC